MYEIKKANEINLDLIKSFLAEVPTIEDLDEDILRKASVLFLDDKIYGIISYESFFNYALIRYFVFKRNVDEMIIRELFSSIENSVNSENIEYIFSLVNQSDIFDLFVSLDFEEVPKESVFVEEQNFKKTRFKDTRLMLKKICS